jgi:BirA family transcriptional regulator, biotin operon repressor / biotin---[acetyl-CoA-carboxylase] ligase
MAALARTGLTEAVWLRAERQSAGRGRQGRTWSSPAGNFSGSTLVRLRTGDPAAATLALVAGVATWEAVSVLCARGDVPGLALKWPNDLLLGGAKIAGILLERVDEAVVVGIGVNLHHHPDLPDRPATSLAAAGCPVDPQPFAETLAESFGRWLARWRGEGLASVRAAWLAAAHPPGTALTARLPDGGALDGLFAGLDADGALRLRLASGEQRVIHAADVFLL